MEFTGERYIPQARLDSEIDIEHHQRYLSIRELVQGRVVVDAASGAGYGAAILAESAASVLGIDISPGTVRFAAETYRRDNLRYVAGSVTALPLADRSVDVLVSFETVEHVAEPDQHAFLRECRRVLKPDGLLVISTPDKAVYSDRPRYQNEYHLKEFYLDEFTAFLSSSFRNVVLSRQFAALGYFLSGDVDGAGHAFQVINQEALGNAGKYLVAFCSETPLPALLAQSTVFVDQQNAHQRKVDRVVQLQGEIIEKNEVITNLEMWVQKCRDTIAERDAQLSRLNSEHHELQQGSAQQEDEIRELQGRLTRQEEVIAAQQRELDRIHRSKSWKILKVLQRLAPGRK